MRDPLLSVPVKATATALLVNLASTPSIMPTPLLLLLLLLPFESAHVCGIAVVATFTLVAPGGGGGGGVVAAISRFSAHSTPSLKELAACVIAV